MAVNDTHTTEAERVKAAIESGPAYPDLGATVAKFRRKANQVGSIREMLPYDRRAYADAIEKAIHAKNRALHNAPDALVYWRLVLDAVHHATASL